ncbi:MAG: NUDIX hydrolase [Candidatus Micrarchaeota archaeon]|nr:NUDIX hydrolase [Candidatus Micrarchaeota archaeon]
MEAYDFSRATHYTVSVFVIDKQRILFLKQNRSPFWLLPGGHIEDSELPHEAAIREVLEETGLRVELLEKADEASRTKTAIPLPLPHHVRMLPCRNKRDFDMVFTARVTEGNLKLDSESKEARWFSKQELLNNPEIGPHTKYYSIKTLDENPSV